VRQGLFDRRAEREADEADTEVRVLRDATTAPQPVLLLLSRPSDRFHDPLLRPSGVAGHETGAVD
jgi:hypothetical protein